MKRTVLYAAAVALSVAGCSSVLGLVSDEENPIEFAARLRSDLSVTGAHRIAEWRGEPSLWTTITARNAGSDSIELQTMRHAWTTRAYAENSPSGNPVWTLEGYFRKLQVGVPDVLYVARIAPGESVTVNIIPVPVVEILGQASHGHYRITATLKTEIPDARVGEFDLGTVELP